MVARAYLDQLARSHALPADRATAVRTALDRADTLTPRSARAGEAAQQLDSLAAQLESAGTSASGADKARISALAALLEAKASGLR